MVLQSGLISRRAADTTTSLTPPGRWVPCILLGTTVSVCLQFEGWDKKAMLCTPPPRGSAVCSQERGRTCRQRQASCCQVQSHFLLPGARGCLEQRLDLRLICSPQQTSHKQERAPRGGRQDSNQFCSDLLFFPSPFVLKLTMPRLICCTRELPDGKKAMYFKSVAVLSEACCSQRGMAVARSCVQLRKCHLPGLFPACSAGLAKKGFAQDRKESRRDHSCCLGEGSCGPFHGKTRRNYLGVGGGGL